MEAPWEAREENSVRPKRRFLPFMDVSLFHSELGAATGHRKAEAARSAPYGLERSLRDKGNTKNASDSMLTYRKQGERRTLGAGPL